VPGLPRAGVPEKVNRLRLPEEAKRRKNLQVAVHEGNSAEHRTQSSEEKVQNPNSELFFLITHIVSILFPDL